MIYNLFIYDSKLRSLIVLDKDYIWELVPPQSLPTEFIHTPHWHLKTYSIGVPTLQT